ncbi:hypothetical protein K461DRAFT_274549 [Myriangium duriaei CBS 260.36]|uniref:Uncharacterized protein n=1 Tax=Myriangium duriaei CBS 260.36 TaxID=1168546 RepID=A0A9P4J5N7_9PEZI|nr:hypothetical protein K461DRAFT_274549 [Myriangium duriaei CBS 260.36]
MDTPVSPKDLRIRNDSDYGQTTQPGKALMPRVFTWERDQQPQIFSGWRGFPVDETDRRLQPSPFLDTSRGTPWQALPEGDYQMHIVSAFPHEDDQTMLALDRPERTPDQSLRLAAVKQKPDTYKFQLSWNLTSPWQKESKTLVDRLWSAILYVRPWRYWRLLPYLYCLRYLCYLQHLKQLKYLRYLRYLQYLPHCVGVAKLGV